MTRPYRLTPEELAKKQERMRKLHADPEFAKAHAERAAKRMRKLLADPEFAKARAERMKRIWRLAKGKDGAQ